MYVKYYMCKQGGLKVCSPWEKLLKTAFFPLTLDQAVCIIVHFSLLLGTCKTKKHYKLLVKNDGRGIYPGFFQGAFQN